MRLLPGVILFHLFTQAAVSQQPASQPRAPANPADVASPDAIIAAVYDVISGPAGKVRDWNRMRSLFVPGARLIPAGVDSLGRARALVWSVDDYINRSGPSLERNGFFEREIARRSESFGRILHAFSTYESRRNESDQTPFMRAIPERYLRSADR